MGAIEVVFGKDALNINLLDIQNLVDKKIEENRILEYKDPDILNHPGDLSKWISCFLNAEGGVIIIGVCEDNLKEKENINAKIYPTQIKYVSIEYGKERIEQLIFGNIRCSVKPDIKIIPIRDPDDPTKIVFIVEIPQGDNPPYQAADDKYYRRINVTKYALSHYEIADFFGRRRKPNLKLYCTVTNPLNIKAKKGPTMSYKSNYKLQISIGNNGQAAAKYARVTISFENIEIIKVNSGPGHRIDQLRKMPSLQWDNPIGIIYNGTGADVIWDLDVKLKRSYIGTIYWEVMAEDVDILRGNWAIDGMEIADVGIKNKPYSLRSYEERFDSPPKTSDDNN